MRMIVTAGVLSVALLLAAISAVQARTAPGGPCEVVTPILVDGE